MPADYQSTARALALPLDDPDDFEDPISSPVWNHRRSTSGQFGRHHGSREMPSSFMGRLRYRAESSGQYVIERFQRLSLLYKILSVLGGMAFIALAVVAVLYSEKLWQAMVPVAEWMRAHPARWLILWTATLIVSFPPLFGYSTCVTGAGFIYGVGRGSVQLLLLLVESLTNNKNRWLIAASGTIIGSTITFLICQTLLRNFATRLAARDKRFAALSSTLQHDGLKLLCMVRLCPLPYSFSNAAVATFPTVRWPGFMFATSVAAPKLFIHVFIGSRLAVIAESGGEMDFSTKCLNYLGIAVGAAIGIITGYVIYKRTQSRAAELEAEEAEHGLAGLSGSGRNDGDRTHSRENSGDLDDDYRDYLSDEEVSSDPFGGADSDIEADLGSGKAKEGRR